MSNAIDRKNAVRDQIRKFITATEDDRLNIVTFGFEIETQSHGSDDECSSETWQRIYNELDIDDYEDTEARHTDESERLDRTLKDDDIDELLDGIGNWEFDRKVLDTFQAHNNKNYWGSPGQKFLKNALKVYAKKLKARFEAITGEDDYHPDYVYCIKTVKTFSNWFRDPKKIKAIKNDDHNDYDLPWFDAYQEDASEYCCDGDYQLDLETVLDNHPDMRLGSGDDLSVETSDIETVEDQSVTGVEIRTIGGHKFDKIVALAKYAFEKIDETDHYIDRECSCHIHIKLSDDIDVKHYFGDGKLHAAIMEYLVWNIDRLPKSVQDRIIQGQRHIEPTINNNGKFQWVHFHPQNTIEFRLFGNIDNANDLEQCLIITTEALAYGYQLRFSDYDRSLTDTVLTECFENLNCDCEESCLCYA